jgi:glycosyltransferase involved in cell wall biosynthesis
VRATDRLLGPRTRHALAVSGTVREHLHLDRNIPRDSIRVFYHGVDTEAFRPVSEELRTAERRALGIPEGAIAAGTTTRLHPSKGHRYLVRALAQIADRVPNLWLLLANEGEEEASLRSEVDALGLGGRVLFIGSRPDVRSFLCALDIFVIPSLSEGFPNSMLEAMATGRPVISTDVDGMGEMLAPEQDALVVPAADPDALAQQLQRLGRDEDLRSRLAQASTRFAETLSIENTVERLTQLYHHVGRTSTWPGDPSPSAGARSPEDPRLQSGGRR